MNVDENKKNINKKRILPRKLDKKLLCKKKKIRKFVNKQMFSDAESNLSQKLKVSEAEKIQITNYQEQILLGTILGDGSLKFNEDSAYKNARFGMRHSIVQLRWFLWKICQLEGLFTKKAIHVQKPDGYSTKPKVHFQTRALPCFTKLHNEVYTNNEVDFTKAWLGKLTPFSLMVWWLDDGGKIGEGARKGKWSTQGWGLDGNKRLKKLLKEIWSIDCRIIQMISVVTGEEQYYLELSQNNLKKLLRIIMPLIPVKTFVYKAFLTYKDQRSQQSWIAEMKQLMNEQFHEEIDNLFEKTRSKADYLERYYAEKQRTVNEVVLLEEHEF